MLGNCATGKLRMVIAPTITITMEITMATMGRLIKNFDMGLPSFGVRDKRLGVDRHARTHLLYALGNHALAALQSFGNNPAVADAVTDFHRSYAHLVLAVHHRYLITALQLREGALRYNQRPLLEADDRTNFAVAAGTQNISRIGK